MNHARIGPKRADASSRPPAITHVVVSAKYASPFTVMLSATDQWNPSRGTVGKCAGFWPPLIASGKPFATAGAKASLLGTTKRADGRLQVTYNHHPLYTFVKDTRKGQTNGEEADAFGAEWYVVGTNGKKIEEEGD